MKLFKRLARMEKMDLVITILVTILAICSLLPLFWLITNSLKPSTDIYKMPPDILPKTMYLDNYKELFNNQPALRWTFNSFFVSFVTTTLSVIFSALAAYAFAKLHFKGKNILFALFIGSLMIPKETFIVPLFKLVVAFDWVDTYQALIIPNLATCFGVFMLKSFFESIPNSIRESAKLDGASEWTIFWKLMLPIAKPGIGALFILNFVTFWNDYLWQLLMARSKEMNTLTVGVAGLMQEINPNMGLKVAGAAVAAMPMILIFIMFQKYFTKGIAAGAVKE
ncbi:carbohydrate ABC transporter permease [Vagococcus intermedius]|uniref:Carbohydrate ABC transporter permease n=1 Tax=Vagococcus intermedius TaxID=2991418 RepID=A0AAF0I4X5_9ENTE|nr:carbohydrate ABC transporter permease [Vagococcus intermedius]WEG72598.1 carbohydrate ABC transporter permease [Vagococcus intermedius]WEG74684.1 carbohydrate ABC transporter permease [Vagococcus intermedius]